MFRLAPARSILSAVLGVACLAGCPASVAPPIDGGGVDSGFDAARADAGPPDAGLDPRVCSPCRAMSYEECLADLRCEAVPIWITPDIMCGPYDDRGFSPRCRRYFPGCRARGVHSACITAEEYLSTCTTCDWSSASVDALGCRQCSPCSPGVDPNDLIRDIEPCAVAALCLESPAAGRCVDGGTSDAGSPVLDAATGADAATTDAGAAIADSGLADAGA